MRQAYDTVIVGLGAMGSAVAFHLAQRGRRVLGLDRFTPPHAFGSSHGDSRVIREAYYEHPLYVPFVQRAYDLWYELQKDCGQALLQITGGLMSGAADSALLSGARHSAETHGLAHELLDAAAARRRFPVLHLSDDMLALFEPRAGILCPEACVAAHLQSAAKHGAELRFGSPVARWAAQAHGASVWTATERYDADTLVLCAGPWMSQLLAELAPALTVERQVQFWFEPASNRSHFTPERCPIYGFEYAPECLFYGFPDCGSGVKAAIHHQGVSADPDALERSVSPQEEAAVRALLREYVPAANGRLLRSAVCMYTNTPDAHFVIDLHPLYPQVVIVSACSGHGFKFAPAIGEMVAELVIDGRSRYDCSLFRMERLFKAHE